MGIGEFKSVVDTETETFNTNAETKLAAYNQNDSQKRTAYNTNATEKLAFIFYKLFSAIYVSTNESES